MIGLLDVEMRRAEQLRGAREFMSARSRRTLALGPPAVAILDILSRLLLTASIYPAKFMRRPFAQ
jgi:hypothetical protein